MLSTPPEEEVSAFLLDLANSPSKFFYAPHTPIPNVILRAEEIDSVLSLAQK
jgi:hypothetical protein